MGNDRNRIHWLNNWTLCPNQIQQKVIEVLIKNEFDLCALAGVEVQWNSILRFIHMLLYYNVCWRERMKEGSIVVVVVCVRMKQNARSTKRQYDNGKLIMIQWLSILGGVCSSGGFVRNYIPDSGCHRTNDGWKPGMCACVCVCLSVCLCVYTTQNWKW